MGGVVENGTASVGTIVKIKRNGDKIGSGVIESLQSGKNPVISVQSGSECGIRIKTADKILEGDLLELYKEEIKEKELTFNK